MICPSVDELEHYLSGDLPSDSRSLILDHVADCSSCRTALHELSENLRLEPMIRSLLAELPQAHDPSLIGTTVGPYRILSELGRGGTGIVYAAEQPNPRRRVALKLLNAHYSSDRRYQRMMEREVQVLARLQHPSIASIYEAGLTDDGRAYFAMELVEGQPVTAYANRKELPVNRRLELFNAVADAIAHAHQRGIIHRDLKPSNILVGDDGLPKVLDFGLAKILTSDADENAAPRSIASEIGRVAGTVPYMSPEQIAGASVDVDVRSDVYSLGVVLYELLTGRLPYALERTHLANAARIICEQPPTPPSRLIPGLRGDLETVVLKALEKDTGRRYPSAAEFSSDIHRYLRNEPVTARPAGGAYLLRKFAQRNKALVATAALSLVLLMAATGLAVGQAYVATRQRDAAERRLDYARDAAAYVLWGVGSQIDYVLGTRDIQRHLAEVSFKYHRRLADESPDGPEGQLGLWRAIQRLCELSMQDGDDERFGVLSGMLLDQLERAAELHPQDALVLRKQAQACRTLAEHAEMAEDVETARQHALQALDIYQTLADRYDPGGLPPGDPSAVAQSGPKAGEQPAHVQDRMGLARAHVQVAGLTPDSGEAARHYAEARRRLDETMPTDPTLEPIYQSDLSEYAPLAPPIMLRVGSRKDYERTRAEIFAGQGESALASGDLEQAREHFRDSLSISQRLLAQRPGYPANMAAVASAQVDLARLLLQRGDHQAAGEYLQLALDAYRRLSDADPKNVIWPKAIAETEDLLAATG